MSEERDPLEGLRYIREHIQPGKYLALTSAEVKLDAAIATWEKERADRGPTDFRYEVLRAALERIEGEMRHDADAHRGEEGRAVEVANYDAWADELRALREGESAESASKGVNQ